MNILTVSLSEHLEKDIEELVKRGYGSRTDIALQAITKFIEDIAVQDVLEAEQEIKESKIVKGDLYV